MKADWLAATHFERTHEVISAINTLSIHAKLVLAGVADPTPNVELEEARSRLTGFLKSLEGSLGRVVPNGDGTYVGSDPWLREVALQYLGAGRHGERRPEPSVLPLADFADLVRFERANDLERLIPHLQQLRSTIEEQSQADIAGILGDASW